MLTETLYTVKEVAAMLRCHPKTVYTMIERGKLRAFTLGGGNFRIPEEALQAVMRAEREN